MPVRGRNARGCSPTAGRADEQPFTTGQTEYSVTLSISEDLP
jgi:hypothetical protein